MDRVLFHLNFANVYFNCPYCAMEWNDEEDKYLDRCNNNKSGYTKIKCLCGKRFGMTYDMAGDAVGFKLNEDGHSQKGIIN